MRNILIWCLLSLSSIAHASWNPPDQRPVIPAYTPPGELGPNVDVLIGYEWGNGQWADVYFPKDKNGFTPEMVQSAHCVFVHYFGGSWAGGDPRAMPVRLINYFVNDNRCILIATSYPLSDYDHSTGELIINNVPSIGSFVMQTGINLGMIVGDDLIGNLRTGSVFQTFDLFYKNFYMGWKASNPSLQLWVGGESAGAYLAQRVAEDGRWPVQYSVVTELPVVNPGSQSPGATSVLVGDSAFDPHSCPNHLNPTNPANLADCNFFRNLYGQYQGGYNQLDLQLYHGRNTALIGTYYLGNICDQVAEVGAALLGWFNSLPGNKYLMIHDYCPEFPGNGHACGDKLLNDFFDNTGVWKVNSIVNGGAPTLSPDPVTGKYSTICKKSIASAQVSSSLGDIINN